MNKVHEVTVSLCFVRATCSNLDLSHGTNLYSNMIWRSIELRMTKNMTSPPSRSPGSVLECSFKAHDLFYTCNTFTLVKLTKIINTNAIIKTQRANNHPDSAYSNSPYKSHSTRRTLNATKHIIYSGGLILISKTQCTVRKCK